MKDVQCYELFGGIALKNHAFSFFPSFSSFFCSKTGNIVTELEIRENYCPSFPFFILENWQLNAKMST